MESIFVRRQELISKLNSGSKLSSVVKELSLKYGVTDKAIYADYRNRHKWLRDVLTIKDPELAYLDSLGRQRKIYEFAIKEYLSAKSSSSKIQALRLLRDLESDVKTYVILEGYSQRIKALKDEIRLLKEAQA